MKRLFLFVLVAFFLVNGLTYGEEKGEIEMSQRLKVFMESIKTETLGFSFGDPWRHDEGAITCVLPIIRVAEKDPSYLTLAEAKKVTIKDTGAIDSVMIINEEDRPVFIRMGELLVGATQNRTAVMSRVIMPGTKEEIGVKCVHASRGIVNGAEFETYGYAPEKDSSYAASLHTSGQVAQGDTWNGDAAYFSSVVESAGRIIISANSDDLAAVRDQYNLVVKDIIEKVPLVDNQIGMVLIDTRGFHSLDCFDLHASWKAVKKALTEKESLAVAEKDDSGVFEYKPDKAKEAVKAVLETDYTERLQYGGERTETVTIDFGKYVGEVVALDSEVIHLLIARK